MLWILYQYKKYYDNKKEKLIKRIHIDEIYKLTIIYKLETGRE